VVAVQVSEELERIFHGGSATKPGVARPPGRKAAEGEEGENGGKRERELRDRKAYLKNFWYVAGESPHSLCHVFCMKCCS
jgi:hypothetical protein